MHKLPRELVHVIASLLSIASGRVTKGHFSIILNITGLSNI